MSMSIRLSRILVLAAGLSSAAPAAFAHHMMDNQLPDTLIAGLLSGLGHPIIGLDHLAFILAAGLLAAPRQRGFLLPLAFVAASILGAVLHLAAFDLPAGEYVIAGSVILLGLLLLSPRRIGDGLFLSILAAAGLFHGYAFAESIIGAEPTPLVAYFVGFTAIQYAIAAGVCLLWRLLAPVWLEALPRFNRMAGAGIAGVGLLFLALNIAG